MSDKKQGEFVATRSPQDPFELLRQLRSGCDRAFEDLEATVADRVLEVSVEIEGLEKAVKSAV